MESMLIGRIEKDAPARLNVYLNEIGPHGDAHVTFNTNEGGIIADGITVYDMLRAHKGTVTTHVNESCVGVAAIAYLAGDVRTCGAEATFMFCRARISLFGTVKEIRAVTDEVDRLDNTMRDIFKHRTNGHNAALLTDNDAWFQPLDALSAGIITQ